MTITDITIIQRMTPITVPAMIPIKELPPLSLPVPGDTVRLTDVNAIEVVVATIVVSLGELVASLVDTMELLESTLVVSLVDVVEVNVVVLLVDTIELVEGTVVILVNAIEVVAVLKEAVLEVVVVVLLVNIAVLALLEDVKVVLEAVVALLVGTIEVVNKIDITDN